MSILLVGDLANISFEKERLLSVMGTIMQMEFLHPPQNDPSQIILLLIVCHGKRARIIWFEWNSTATLRESEMRPNRYSLPPDEWSPLLLIPFAKLPAFMIVCEARITIYKDILTGIPSQYIQSVKGVKEPEAPGLSKSLPLWTQWARPLRPPAKDAIYLSREDGIVQYLEFQENTDHGLDSTHQAGSLGTTVDTAFAVLDVGPNTVDLLVAGGDSSEGGLFRMWARKDPKFLNNIANWTPLRCLTAMNRSGEGETLNVGSVLTFSRQQRLFACIGKGDHGAISELRYGHQASEIFSSVIVGDAMRDGVLGIWAFHGFFGDNQYHFEGSESRNDRTYIVISHPTQTTLVRIRAKPMPLREDRTEIDLDLEFTAESLDLDVPTKIIFAEAMARGLLVHVTEASITMSSISADEIKEEDPDDVDMDHDKTNLQEITAVSHFELPSSDARILSAAIHHDDEKSVLLLSVQMHGRFSLQLGHLKTEYEPRGEPWYLQSQPSCIHLQIIGTNLLAFVATLNSELIILRVNDRSLNSPMTSPYLFDGSFAICDSIAIIVSIPDQRLHDECLVVCGLRNGSIQTLHCTGDGSSETLTLCEAVRVGNTSVTVRTDITRKSRVFLLCEQRLCTLEYPQGVKFRAPAKIHNVWITNRDWPALQQGSILTFTQVTDSWLPRGANGLTFGSLICIDADDRLRVVNLHELSNAQMVPRNLQARGSPKNILYSAYLNKLIVLSDRMRVSPTRQSNRYPRKLGLRIPQPTITYLDPDADTDVRADSNTADVKQEDYLGINDGILSSERKATEDFLGITEWFPKIGDSEHHLLVVNTKYIRHAKPVGRLLIFAIPPRSAENRRMDFKREIALEAPVYSVAVHPDRRSIVYCSGNDLCIHSLAPNSTGIKLQASVKAAMRSPGRSLTIHDSFIYVSTVRESLAVFKYADDKIIYQYGDQSARDGFCHILIPGKSLVLASDMTSTVVGLWQPPERRIDNAMTTVFEAMLPSSVNGLQRVTRPIWYRDPVDPEEDQAIIGSSEDGTLTQFDILSKGWRLLRFIQNMAERNAVVCPFKGHRAYKRHIDPATSKPHYMHINGNILQRVLERGAEELIKEMLNVEPDLESHTDFDSAQARWERFKELASEVVDIMDADWLGRVVQWITYRLRSAL